MEFESFAAAAAEIAFLRKSLPDFEVRAEASRFRRGRHWKEELSGEEEEAYLLRCLPSRARGAILILWTTEDAARAARNNIIYYKSAQDLQNGFGIPSELFT